MASLASRSSGSNSALGAERRAGKLLAPERLLLEGDLHAVPMFERDARAAHDDVAAAAHPVRRLVAGPDDRVHFLGSLASGLPVPSLKPIRLRGVCLGPKSETKPACTQRMLAIAIGEPRELPHGVEGDLRIVGAGLHVEIAAGARRDQLIAGEMRQVDEAPSASAPEAVAVDAVLLEQAGAEAERHRQPRRRQGPARRTDRPERRNRRRPGISTGLPSLIGARRPRSRPQQRLDVVALRRREVERGDIGVRLRGRDHAALMRAEERLDRARRAAVVGACGRSAARDRRRRARPVRPCRRGSRGASRAELSGSLSLMASPSPAC